VSLNNAIPGSDSQGHPDLRKITRNLSLTFAAFGDTGHRSRGRDCPEQPPLGWMQILRLVHDHVTVERFLGVTGDGGGLVGELVVCP
jgi:hypothetical protein